MRWRQEMPRHTGRPVDYVVRLKGNVHIQTADGYQGLLRKYPLRPGPLCFCLGVRYRSDGAVVVNLVLYWGWGHREPWYLATSLPDAKVAVGQYRRRMQPEQYFRDGKQYFALDRGTATTTAWLGRMLVGLLLACCLLPLAARRASVAVSAAGVFVGEAGTDGVGDGMLSGYAGAPARMVRLARYLKVGTREWAGQARAARLGAGGAFGSAARGMGRAWAI